MRISWILSLCVAYPILSAGQVRADVLFNNGPPDLINAHHSDFDNSTGTVDAILLGDDFSLSAPGTLGAVHWSGLYLFDNTPPAADDFTIRIYNFGGATPSPSPLASVAIGNASRSLAGSNILGYDVYQYDAALPDIILGSGHYLLSIVNNTSGTDSDWFWADSSQSGDAFTRPADSDPWAPYFGNVGVSFSLDGTSVAVPEPSSLALLTLAAPFVLVASSLRRRKTPGR
jgi:hypothetical protein